MGTMEVLVSFGGAVVVTLSGAVGYLYRALESAKKAIETKLDQCEEDRLNLWKRIAELEKEFKDCECEDHYKKKQ